MDFDEAFDKSKKIAKDAVGKIDEARKSEKAGKAREDIVHGFDKIMKAVLPGEHKAKTEKAANRLVEPSDEEPPRELQS